MTQTKYDASLLRQIIERDKIKVAQFPDAITCASQIEFTCECGEKRTMKFHSMVTRVSKCASCMKQQRKQKCETTCMEKYGVTNVSKVSSVKEKKGLGQNNSHT